MIIPWVLLAVASLWVWRQMRRVKKLMLTKKVDDEQAFQAIRNLFRAGALWQVCLAAVMLSQGTPYAAMGAAILVALAAIMWLFPSMMFFGER